MIPQHLIHRLSPTGFFLALFVCLFVSPAKADTLNNFQLYRGKTLIVAGCENGGKTYRVTTSVNQFTIHPVDTFHFQFHYCSPHVNVTQYLVLRDSLHRCIAEFHGDITIEGRTLIERLKTSCPGPIEFCFFEMEDKPVEHTNDANGNRAYFSQVRPPAELLFTLPITIAEN